MPAVGIAELVRESAEPFETIDGSDLEPFLDRVAGARVVLLGESTHGTAEFYAMRARITKELIQRHGFTIVAVEADWPDAAKIDRSIRPRAPAQSGEVFARFPTWMWRNAEVAAFLGWLRAWNAGRPPERQVSFRGLDLYALFQSIEAVLGYLGRVDPPAAAQARDRYACLLPWARQPEVYGRLALGGGYQICEAGAVEMLQELLARRLELEAHDGDWFFDAVSNARLVAAAERYYRAMYRGAVESWNLRDRHMFETLQRLLDYHGAEARAVVWAHNSHVGNAAATEMSEYGELNLGELARAGFGAGAYLVGFGTDTGTVGAAAAWGEPMQVMAVRPALEGSYERLCHDCGIPAFLLPLSTGRSELVAELAARRLQRAIGVVYRPESERESHYYYTSLPNQFDEYVWLDRTSAVRPLS